LNEKLKEELKRIEDIYENILESIHGAKESICQAHIRKHIPRQKKEQQVMVDWRNCPINEKKALYLKWLNSKSEEDKGNYIRKKTKS
jgi:hypothetical protein